MIKFKTIKHNLSQILALTEKNIKLNFRFKFNILFTYITPIITILMPLIVMSKLFLYNSQFGPWTENNYFILQFIAYNIFLLRGVISEFPMQFRAEKFWKTLPALMVAPFNRFNFLFGIILTQLFLIFVPFIIFFIIGYIFNPISFFTIIFIIGIYFGVTLIFSGIGLILGIFAISNENIWKALVFLINLILWASCITYPFEIFPDFIQRVINLNPLYYIFDLLRWAWIENNIIITIISHPLNSLILILCLITIPSIGVYLFNIIFKKFGITGY